MAICTLDKQRGFWIRCTPLEKAVAIVNASTMVNDEGVRANIVVRVERQCSAKIWARLGIRQVELHVEKREKFDMSVYRVFFLSQETHLVRLEIQGTQVHATRFNAIKTHFFISHTMLTAGFCPASSSTIRIMPTGAIHANVLAAFGEQKYSVQKPIYCKTPYSDTQYMTFGCNDLSDMDEASWLIRRAPKLHHVRFRGSVHKNYLSPSAPPWKQLTSVSYSDCHSTLISDHLAYLSNVENINITIEAPMCHHAQLGDNVTSPLHVLSL
ncbi:hypothetical protein EDD18DRAFT_1429804 [Armillaria luteobubalina]|uniref:Uncharacterized protein n=1 Tax=Armillaria luteobubalina TaxID=153913 RepID=A0AA39PHY4_9AGAR|nr:hypothetical protein EDD18DRAFT_1429804 [Armillaria luteobubalina]